MYPDQIPYASQSAHCSYDVLGRIIQTSCSTLIDIASNSALAHGIYQITFILWITCGIILFYIGFKLSTFWFRR